MKENSVLHVLMYLFRNHLQDDCQLEQNNNSLIQELETVGFIRPAINQAIGWLTNLITQEKETISSPSSRSFRVYSDYEREFFPPECLNLLLSLEKQGILNANTREQVIQQAMDLDSEGIDASLVKWVALMVLFNRPEEGEALSRMELLVLDNPLGGIH